MVLVSFQYNAGKTIDDQCIYNWELAPIYIDFYKAVKKLWDKQICAVGSRLP